MSDGERRERIQFATRAFFVVTFGIAIAAASWSWLTTLDNYPTVLKSSSLGFLIGFVSIAILQNLDRTCLLVAMVIGLNLSAIWYSGQYLYFGIGLIVGGLVAFQGIALLNAFFRFCGVTVSVIDTDAAVNQKNLEGDDSDSDTRRH